ncbi:MAG: PQ loop repeat-domain-containing protein [Benjaminiella poitrasii]|nr:MAG: PQ loop repeat-domain-containing protein [Benjaminiella poitrasii]
MDQSKYVQLSTWPVISNVIGWCYFLAWSVSFYPQVILNWQRKSVKGLSMDFLYYNVYGFFCYWIFNMSFFFSKEIQNEYKERNNSNENLVRFNDVMFATHAFLISLFTLTQTFYYKKDSSQHISTMAKYFIAVTLTGIVGISLFIILFGANMIMWIDLLYFLSYIKLIISLIKYIPQAWLNFKRKSTTGWSIYNILLDFTGGVLSITQLFIDSWQNNDWSGISGIPVKLGLGLLSIAFDVMFMVQHYILYYDHDDITSLNTVDEERRRLIAEGLVPRTIDEEEEEDNYSVGN